MFAEWCSLASHQWNREMALYCIAMEGQNSCTDDCNTPVHSSTYPTLALGSDSHTSDLYFSIQQRVWWLTSIFTARSIGLPAFWHIVPCQWGVAPMNRPPRTHQHHHRLEAGDEEEGGKMVNGTCGIKQPVDVTSQWQSGYPEPLRGQLDDALQELD